MISKGDIEIRSSEDKPKNQLKQSYKSSSVNMSLELKNIEKNVVATTEGSSLNPRYCPV